MKNFVKMLGIIVLVAIIGSFSGCGPADPDKQTLITIEDLSGFDGKFANVTVYDSDIKANAKVTGVSQFLAISGSVVKELPLSDDKGAVTLDKGAVVLVINDNIEGTGERIYKGQTTRVISLGEGEVKLLREWFTPPIPVIKTEKPSADHFATYKTTYKNSHGSSIEETIILAEDELKISDSGDNLTFKIKKWETAAVPDDQPAYAGAYKFTGKITVGSSGYIGSSQTSPGFTSSDVNASENGPDCWMYIYFRTDSEGTAFIRTAFSKEGNVNTGIITGSAPANKVRVYTKQ